ncbi:MAG: ribonuclease HI family protein [Nanoarchaeota archaeon]|nr:ribonuclease HI family protein [Nanoarchaeota archaeon]
MITIYFDGLCKPHPGGVATYGYVVYQDGKAIKKGCRVIGEGEGMTVNVAEYSALKRALEWLNEQGINDDIVVKGDSMLVINQMKGLYRIKSKTSKFFVPIIQKLLERKKICFVWIPREENMEADMLSNVAYKRYMLKIALCKAVFVAHKAG